MLLSKDIIAQLLLSRHEQYLRSMISDELASFQNRVSEGLILNYSDKDKYDFLINEYKAVNERETQFQSPEQFEKATWDKIVRGLKQITLDIPITNDSKAKVFQAFLSCCDDLSSQLAKTEDQLNTQANVNVEIVIKNLRGIQQNFTPSLHVLNQAVSILSENQYVDQEIVMNQDNLCDLVKRIQNDYSNVTEINPVERYGLFDNGSGDLEKRIISNKQIDFEPYFNLIADIRRFAQIEIDKLNDKELSGLFDRIIPSESLIKDKEHLLNITKRNILLSYLKRSNRFIGDKSAKGSKILYCKLKDEYNNASLKDELYRILSDNGYIPHSTFSLNKLRQFFKGPNPTEEKIVWLKTIGDLNNFIGTIENYTELPSKGKWDIVASFFCTREKKSLDPDNIRMIGSKSNSKEFEQLAIKIKKLFKKRSHE